MVKSKQNPHPGPFKKLGGYTRFPVVRFALLLVTAIALVMTSCGGESRTVLPFDKSGFATASLSGTTLMTVEMVYPANGATVIPVDSNIVLAFSKDVNAGSITGNITLNGSVSGNITYTQAVSGNIVTLNPTPTLQYNETVTVNIGTGVTATTGEALYAAYTGSFQAAPDGTATYYPRVITGTNLPSGGPVPKNTIMAQVTFSKAVTVVDAARVSISGGTASITAWTQVPGTNTYQFTLSGLDYNTSYTMSLNAAGAAPCISDGTNCLVDTDGTGDNHFRWSFTTETDPASAAMLVDSYWTSSIDHESAYVYFTTSETVDVTAGAPECRVRYGTSSGTYTINTAPEDNWDGGTTSTQHILHRIQLTGLTASTTYYYRAYVDVNNNSAWDVGEPQSAEGSFTTRKLLSIATGDQTGPVTLQDAAGGGFVFWQTNQAANNDIYGQYFNSAGTPMWTVPGGSAVSSHANNQSYIAVIPSLEPVGAIVAYLDGNNICAKHVNSAYAFSWPSPGATAAEQGVLLVSDAIASSAFSLAYINVPLFGDSFAVAYIQTGTNDLYSVIRNTADGSNYIAAFGVDTTGSFTAPHALPIENDLFLVFYHDGSDILTKCIDGSGIIQWPDSFATTAGTAISGLSGYNVVKVLTAATTAVPYDAYVLASDGSNTALVRVVANGSIPGGGSGWNSGNAVIFPGRSPDMIVDKISATDDRIIVTYRVTHAGGSHIEYCIYDSKGNPTVGPTTVTSNASTYDCFLPKVTSADSNDAAASAFYVSWFDGRLAAGDYAVYASLFDPAGAQQWTSFIYDTAADGGGNPFALNALYRDDGGAPYGILPIWQEYTVGTDLYYETVNDAGSY